MENGLWRIHRIWVESVTQTERIGRLSHIMMLSVTKELLKRLNNKKKRFFQKTSQNLSEIGWKAYRTASRAYETATHNDKHTCYCESLASILKSNPPKFWNPSSPSPVCNASFLNDEVGSVEVYECADMLNDIFGAVFTREKLENFQFSAFWSSFCALHWV